VLGTVRRMFGRPEQHCQKHEFEYEAEYCLGLQRPRQLMNRKIWVSNSTVINRTKNTSNKKRVWESWHTFRVWHTRVLAQVCKRCVCSHFLYSSTVHHAKFTKLETLGYVFGKKCLLWARSWFGWRVLLATQNVTDPISVELRVMAWRTGLPNIRRTVPAQSLIGSPGTLLNKWAYIK